MEERRQDYTELHSTLAVVKEVVERMEQRLFGDGQPGVIVDLQKRINTLERLWWKVTGALIFVGWLVTAFGRELKAVIGLGE